MLNKAIISLGAIKQNALKVKSKLSSAKLCAVVKADAYGHGAEMVASSLYKIADCFAVALVEEGVSLRLCGIDKQILVFTPPSYKDALLGVRYGLTFTCQSIEDLIKIDSACKKLDKRSLVHIKYNTGMNRLGVDGLDNLKKIIDFCDGKENVFIDGFYSHYCAPQDNNLLIKQTDNFLLANNIVKGYNKNIISHISASGGFLQGQFFDMVRIGILLYGYTPFSSSFNVTPAMKLFTPVIKNRLVAKGENLLYGQVTVEKDCGVSIVRYGYADGLERKKNVTTLNNRCMDVSAVKRSKKSYPVMLNADEVAEQNQTISYEVLVKCAMRSEKIYTL